MKPAINSPGVILAKKLFVDKKDLKNTNKSCAIRTMMTLTMIKKKTSSKKTEGCYCVLFAVKMQ